MSIGSDMICMRGRRKSEESIEIAAYLVKHKPIDESNYLEVESQLDFISKELAKRRKSFRAYGGKENRNDLFLQDEQYRMSIILKALRNEKDKNPSKDKTRKKVSKTSGT